MQQANRYKIEFIGEISRYSLIGLLIFNFLSIFVILFIDPEAFFLGQKIAGTSALVYALGLFLVTALLMIGLYYKIRGNEFIALVYGVFYFINGYLTILYYNSQVPTLIHWLTLVLSIILSAVTLFNQSGKSAEKNEKATCTVFTEKPFAKVLVIIGAIFCFLLYSSIAVITYEKEYNSYIYQIEIDPAAPLHNVTLMIPYPFGISQNITTVENLIGYSAPYFANYSQSIVETEKGKMIKITADSIEKLDTELPQDLVGLYQSILVTGPINSVYPLDREPVLLPKYSPEPFPCDERGYQRNLPGKIPLNCSVYESKIFASFETVPSSQTIIMVSLDGERMISSSRPPRREGYKDSITATVSGSAEGWYNASGSLLTG